jgi:hypothetical protein
MYAGEDGSSSFVTDLDPAELRRVRTLAAQEVRGSV